MPGVSRGMNRACLERAQMSLRQVSAVLAAGNQQSAEKLDEMLHFRLQLKL